MEQREHRRVQRKAELANALLDHLLSSDRADASFRGLAAAAGVTRPTLTHYFGDHHGCLDAALRLAAERGRRWAGMVADGFPGSPDVAVSQMLKLFARGWPMGLGSLHRLGLIWGMGDAELGQTYVREILLVSLGSFEGRITRWAEEGEIEVDDPRAATLSLVTPVVFVLLMQHQLGGQQARPLDTEAFIQNHVDLWLRGVSCGTA